ncbi:MAG: glycosyltransferase [Gemmatimonadales bacterium]
MERQTLQLVAALRASRAWDVHVASLQCEGPLAADLRQLGFADIPCFPLRNLYGPGAVRQILRLTNLLRRLRIDIVHTHDFYTNVVGICAARLGRVPVRIASRRELDVFTPAQRRVEHMAYRLASAVLANCAFLRDRLVAEGVGDAKAMVLFNAILPSRVSCPDPGAPGRLRREWDIPVTAPVIAMLANLYNERKDLITFVRAASAVTRSYPDAVFILAGGGNPRPVEQAVAACQPRPRVITPGSLPEVGPLLNLCTISVLSSHTEGSSNAILESMAAGRPVVATATGGTPELVRDGGTGWLVPPADWVAMAGRIQGLLEDEDMARRMGEQGKALVYSQYSADRQLRQLETIYETLRLNTSREPAPVREAT